MAMSVCSYNASEIEMAWSLNLGSQSNLVNLSISRPVSNLVSKGEGRWCLRNKTCGILCLPHAVTHIFTYICTNICTPPYMNRDRHH